MREKFRRETSRAVEGFDAVLGPTTPAPAPRDLTTDRQPGVPGALDELRLSGDHPAMRAVRVRGCRSAFSSRRARSARRVAGRPPRGAKGCSASRLSQAPGCPEAKTTLSSILSIKGEEEAVRNPSPVREGRKADTSSLAVRGLAAVQTGQVSNPHSTSRDTMRRIRGRSLST